MQARTTMMASRYLRDLFHSGTVTGLTDGQLLAQYAADNDGPAFEALVMRHGPMVMATCRAVLKHEHDVEDAFQSTFLVLARKAGSVRAETALGGWLHRVAYRIAVQAKIESERRLRHESAVAAMGSSQTTRPGPDPELYSLLHAEIDRLPERERLPVILVDLEGLSYDQAASRLRCTVPALCYRLGKARKRLRDRLIRHGVTGESLGIVMASARTMVTASLPASWIRAAVGMPTDGPIPATVAALIQTIIKGMLMAQLKAASAVVVAAGGLVYIGVVVLGAAQTEGPMPAPGVGAVTTGQPAAAKVPPAAQKAAQPNATPGSMIEIRGSVVDPAGKAVVGATVRTVFLGINSHIKPVPEATSGTNGLFLMQVPPLRTFNSLVFRDGMAPLMVATAPGFAPGGWYPALRKPGTAGEVTIRLAEVGPPIEGRIVDLEGRPVAGANVKVDRLWCPREGTLSNWLTQAVDRGAGPMGGPLPAADHDRDHDRNHDGFRRPLPPRGNRPRPNRRSARIRADDRHSPPLRPQQRWTDCRHRQAAIEATEWI